MSKSLRDLAHAATKFSHSPYSHCKVGAAIEMSDGAVFTGANIENSSFGGTVCAERVAILKAVSEGHKKIKRVYVYTDAGWPPCGMCLQVMTEFADAEMEVTFSDKAGKETKKKLGELLTHAFTPEHMK
jgi:cytidine deaminase